MADASFADSRDFTNFHIASEDFVHAVVHRAFAPLRRRAKYKQLSRELHGLSDLHLAELGIARHEIRRIARKGSRGA